MAMCEKCKTSGFRTTEMAVDPSDDTFVGPCCWAKINSKAAQWARPPAQVHVLPAQGDSKEVEYGIEVSNKVGVHAWVNYQGLEISFERSPAQLKTWAERQGLVEKTGT